MEPITFTKEELDIGIMQLTCRKDYFDNELITCKEPSRIKEIVLYMQPLDSLLAKLIKLRVG